MTFEEVIEERKIECARRDFGNITLPPIGLVRAVMKTDPSELARIGKDESPFPLIQDQVVVLRRLKITMSGLDFSGDRKSVV